MACFFFALFQPLRSLVLVLHRNDLVHALSQPRHFYLRFSKVLIILDAIFLLQIVL